MTLPRIPPLFLLSLLAAPAAAQQVLYAVHVPNVAEWVLESSTTGAPANADCETPGGPYAVNLAGITRLETAGFEQFNLPAGHRVTRVQIGVMARFDMGAPASIDLRGSWTSDGTNWNQSVSSAFGLNNIPGNGDCAWREFDITGAEPVWSEAEVNRINVGVRRVHPYIGNVLRVKAFRITVYSEACGSLTLLCNGALHSGSQPARLVANTPLSHSGPLQLTVSGGPPLSSGFTFVGRTTGVWPHIGNGTLCLGSPLRVYPVVQLDHSGYATFWIPPAHPAIVNVAIGEETVLQFVYRDYVGTQFNLSDAISGYACP